jgi:hypothetical protein
MPCSLYSVHVCGNYNTTGAQECHVQVPCTGRGVTIIYYRCRGIPGSLQSGAAIIKLQMQRNTSSLYRGAAIAILQVQRNIRLLIRDAPVIIPMAHRNTGVRQ